MSEYSENVDDRNSVWSDKDALVALVLAAMGGFIGLHRFYVGKVASGIVYILTFGVFGIGVLCDEIMIVRSRFTDKHGKLLKFFWFDLYLEKQKAMWYLARVSYIFLFF